MLCIFCYTVYMKQQTLFGDVVNLETVPATMRNYPSGWKPRRGNFAQVENACSVVRGVLISRLDDFFYYRIQPELSTRLKTLIKDVLNGNEDGTNESINSFVLNTFQVIQCALFPEEFEEDPEAAERLRGLVPRSGDGLQRVGNVALRRFAAMFKKAEKKKVRGVLGQ